MAGYEEILTDPSYAGQIITFTFPHIGNVGTNEHDIETVNLAATPGARGVVLHTRISSARSRSRVSSKQNPGNYAPR
jgi:carbamoyl-phosphate synthase small subunit